MGIFHEDILLVIPHLTLFYLLGGGGGTMPGADFLTPWSPNVPGVGVDGGGGGGVLHAKEEARRG